MKPFKAMSIWTTWRAPWRTRINSRAFVYRLGTAALGVLALILAWDESGASLAEVQAYEYRLYLASGSGMYTTLLPVTCVDGGPPYLCQAEIETLPPPGDYVLQITASDGFTESARSQPLALRCDALHCASVVTSPLDVRISP
jgi:hypothetical protein